MEWMRISHRGNPVVTKKHPSWLAFWGPPLALERRKINAVLSTISIKNIYFHLCKSLNAEGKEYVVDMNLPNTAPVLQPIPGPLPEWLDPVGAAEFGLYTMRELFSAESGIPTASAWSLGLEEALGLGHTTKHPPAPNPFILLHICWEPGRKDGDFGMAAKGKGIPGSQEGECDLCWCCASSFLSTYLQFPSIQ